MAGEAFSLLGHMTVLQEEMHSRQIQWIEHLLSSDALAAYREIIYDVLNDAEESVTLPEALQAYQAETEGNRNWIYRMCWQLAVLDEESLGPTVLSSAEQDLLRTLGRFADMPAEQEHMALEELQRQQSTLFSAEEKELHLDLGQISRVAASDLGDLQDILDRLKSEGSVLQKRLSGMGDISNAELKNLLLTFQTAYRTQVWETLEQLSSAMAQKELASHGFSLALMGRTKAGKSTLHAIMCGEGDLFIGKGSQRTTRFNRVFSWKGLKIIDTPGIGAGEADGAKDTEIAMRVISQADMICFVVADDTITEEVFTVLDRIAEYHRPMIVLLNHKDNISKGSHLKHFEAAPALWKERTDEQRLSGWTDRLERHAAEKGYREIMTVIPVFLLAAWKGKHENRPDFVEASDYPAFVAQIGAMLEKNCLLFKSQTMLDEPSVQLHKALQALEKDTELLTMFREKVANLQERITGTLESRQNEVIHHSQQQIVNQFREFYVKQRSAYIEENYRVQSPFRLQTNFENCFKEAGVLTALQEQIKDCVEEYRTYVRQKTQEIGEEIEFAVINLSEATEQEKADFLRRPRRIIPLRGVCKLVCAALNVVVIWMPAIAIIDIPLGFLTDFLKPKAKQIQNAKMLTNENFRKLTDWQQKRVTDSIMKDLARTTEQDRAVIEQFFKALLEQIDKVLHYIRQNQELLAKSLRKLDTCYAVRVLEYICTDADKFTASDILSAERSRDEHLFRIRTRHGKEFDTEKLRRVTGEMVTVETN